MNRISLFLVSILMTMFSLNCGGGNSSNSNYPRFSSTDNDIVIFNFTSSKNNKLSGDITGVITDSEINLEIPYTADLTPLVAEFTSNSITVEVNGVAQISGVTGNDFSNPVEYTVKAESGDTRVYSVIVKKAPSGEKELKSFTINGMSGQIDNANGNISIELPPRTPKSELISVFDSAGESVTVGGVVQQSSVTTNDFSSQVVYRVTAYDRSEKDYKVNVSVLKDSANSINMFAFKAENNPALPGDVNGVIGDGNIKLIVPFRSSVDSLKAYYETSGDIVKVGTVVQSPGQIENNYTSPVNYTVIAENGHPKSYNVEVEIAKSDAKQITRFMLDGEPGTIDDAAKSISVNFPASKNLSELRASYVLNGVELKIGSNIQTSGVTVNNFSSPVVYTVKADDSSEVNYTVTAIKSEEIAGIWNFDYGSDGSYQIFGADIVDGISGDALHFEKGDYVLVPDSELLTLADAGTIEVVIKADSHQPYAGIVHKGIKKDFSDESYSLQFWGQNGTDGTLRFSVFNSAGGNNYVESETKLSTSVWYYVAASWDASEIKLYVNGNLEDSIPNTIGKVRDSAGALIIGAQLPIDINSSWRNLIFNGAIDRVQISNRALTGREISENYQKLPFASISALPAYILAIAVKNYSIIGFVFGVLMLVLISIFIYNRKNSANNAA